MSNPIRLPSIGSSKYSNDREKVQLPSLEEVIPELNNMIPGFHTQCDYPTPATSNPFYNDPTSRSRATSYDLQYNSYLESPSHLNSHGLQSSHFPNNYQTSPSLSTSYSFSNGRTRSSISGLPSSASSSSSMYLGGPINPPPFPQFHTSAPSSAPMPTLHASFSAQSSPSQLSPSQIVYPNGGPSGGLSAPYNPKNINTQTPSSNPYLSNSINISPGSNTLLSSNMGHPLGSTTPEHPSRKKEIKRRTRTGCLTCRKRRIKCDERKPFCLNCEKSKKECLGYEKKFTMAEKKQKIKNNTQLPPPPSSQHPHMPHLRKLQLVLNN